jgi:hypothetical protein
MKVVGHETIPKHVDRNTTARVAHRLEEGVVISRFVKHGLAAVSPARGAIPHSADGGSSRSRHERKMAAAARNAKTALCTPFLRDVENALCPLFLV